MPLIRMDSVRVICSVWLTMRSTLAVLFSVWASEISGISRVERVERKEEGKNSSGIAIPLSIPNWDRESVFEPV